MISSKIFILALSLVSTGSSVCYLADTPGPRSAKAVADAPAARSSWQAPDFIGASLGAGTLVSSRSYNLIASARGRVRTVFVQPGQHVRKGDVLLQLAPTAFVVAPANGLVTRYLVETGEYLPPASLVARFTESAPFRLRLPVSATRPPLLPGQFVQVQGIQNPGQGVTATVVSSASTGDSLSVDLHVRTASPEPLLIGAPVMVHALLLTP